MAELDWTLGLSDSTAQLFLFYYTSSNYLYALEVLFFFSYRIASVGKPSQIEWRETCIHLLHNSECWKGVSCHSMGAPPCSGRQQVQRKENTDDLGSISTLLLPSSVSLELWDKGIGTGFAAHLRVYLSFYRWVNRLREWNVILRVTQPVRGRSWPGAQDPNPGLVLLPQYHIALCFSSPLLNGDDNNFRASSQDCCEVQMKSMNKSILIGIKYCLYAR